LGQGTEPRQQRLRHRLGVGTRDQPEQQEFKKLVVGKGEMTGRRETLAQALPVAEVMRPGVEALGLCRRQRPLLAEEPTLVFAVCARMPPASLAGQTPACTKPARGEFRPAGRAGRGPPAKGWRSRSPYR